MKTLNKHNNKEEKARIKEGYFNIVKYCESINSGEITEDMLDEAVYDATEYIAEEFVYFSQITIDVIPDSTHETMTNGVVMPALEVLKDLNEYEFVEGIYDGIKRGEERVDEYFKKLSRDFEM